MPLFTGVTDWRNVRLLWIVTMPERNNMSYTMGNSTLNTGELTSVTQPYGGVLEWDHTTFGYASSYSIREVSTRRAKPNATTTWSYGLYHDTVGTTANVVHAWTEVQDAGNATRTRYEFETSTASAFTGLMKLKQVLRGVCVPLPIMASQTLHSAKSGESAAEARAFLFEELRRDARAPRRRHGDSMPRTIARPRGWMATMVDGPI